MQISGAEFLQVLENESYFKQDITVADQAAIDLDQLFESVQAHLTDASFMRVSLVINGGVAEGGTSLSVETNVINLPLRYQNQLRKLVYDDQDYEVNVYMYAENADVSRSQLKISKVSSVAAYADDPEGSQQKISKWFDDQLTHIVEVQSETETDTSEKSAD